MHRLIIVAQCAEEHFSEILSEAPIIFSDKVRLVFVDGSYMEIRYPVDSKYSFHWQREDEIIMNGKEDAVVEDSVTRIDNTIEENVKCVLGFVRSKLEK
ncbi:MAG: hypothetical protein J5U17_12365 [Candidatus Methanoperedens sp.]|nr:hypothetical protein [Candidatus Methanoperedens sp.]MCE8428871.1 hypothetical protein [Candidatus Methanoperedens sp.]